MPEPLVGLFIVFLPPPWAPTGACFIVWQNSDNQMYRQ